MSTAHSVEQLMRAMDINKFNRRVSLLLVY